jgi:peptidyl-prolyl cis-trans isomerase D
MLQNIREKLTGWVAVFILGAIALTLVVSFGNIDTGFSTAGQVAATVNGEDIPLQEFQRLFQRQRQQWEANFREQLPEDLANTMADSVIQSLIGNRLIVGYVRDTGYRINDAEVIKEIQSIEGFQVGGQFSRPAYEAALASAGYSSQRFEFEQRQDMQVQQFQRGIQSSAFFTPDQFRRYIELDGETRDVTYALIPAQSWRARVTLEPGAVDAYYSENQATFTSEESATLEYVLLDYAAILESVEVSEADALEYFNNNKMDFSGPDDRQVSHILIPAGDDETAALIKIVELREQIMGGASFAEIARENSADTLSAMQGGDLGWLGSGELPAPEFEPALAALTIGEVSEPVRTQFGYHLIKLADTRANADVEFAEVRADLVERLRTDQAVELYGRQVDELDELALESLDGLAGVAEVMGLEVKTVPEFTRTAGGGELGRVPQLIDQVFSLEVLEDGENTPVIELDEGRTVVAHVTKVNPPTLRPLDEVAEEIEAFLISNESMLLAATAGNELVEQLKSGADVAEISTANQFEWTSIPAVRRGSGQLPPELSNAVFKAAPPRDDIGDDYQGLLLASGDFAIYRVTGVVPGSPDQFDVEARDQRKQLLADQLGFSQLNALVTTLGEAADTSVAPDLLGNETDLL